MTAEPKAKKSKKGKKRDLIERRFVAKPSAKSKALLGLLFAGALVLGAGVYERFFSDKVPSPSWATYLVAGGALLVAIYILIVPDDAAPLLVGDAGVGEEHGEGVKRIAWCDVVSVSKEGNTLILGTEERGDLRIAIDQHQAAAARVLHELEERLGENITILEEITQAVGAPGADEGEVRKISAVQVAGRRCAASGRVLSFEADVRSCARCGQVYHTEEVPLECVTCGAEMSIG
jgi:hypothetical protein